MIKKVKDLTPLECTIICNKSQWCMDCPLSATHKCLEYSPEKYEQELEVNDFKM